MAGKPETRTQTGILDFIKLSVAVVLLAFAIGQFYYLGTHPLIYGGAVHQVPAAIRLVVLLAVLALAVVTVRFTGVGADSWRYLMSARGEVQRMVWPGRQQTIQATIAVIVLVVFLGVFMWLIDLILQFALRGLTGQ